MEETCLTLKRKSKIYFVLTHKVDFYLLFIFKYLFNCLSLFVFFILYREISFLFFLNEIQGKYS